VLCGTGVVAAMAGDSPGPLHVGPVVELAAASDGRPQLVPSVAYDGAGTFLVVWQQGYRYFEQQQGDILAVRVDREGTLLDRLPLVVSKAPESQEAPQVAFSGGQFLVVWQDMRSGRQWDVYGARVTPEGRVVDPDGFAIAARPDSEALPQVAPAPDGFLVVWQSRTTGYYEVAGAHVSMQAGVTTFDLRNGRSPVHGGELALARIRDGWVLAWNDEKSWSFQNIVTRRFGRLAGDSRRPSLVNVEVAPSVHLGGDGGRLVAAGDRALYVSAQVGGRGQRVWTAALLDSRAVPLRNPNPEKPYGMSKWDPSRMIPVVPGGTAAEGAVAGSFACGRYLLAVRASPSGKPPGVYRVLGARLDEDGRRLDDAAALPVLQESAAPIVNPVSAAAGDRHLVVFEQHDAGGVSRLRARVVSDCG
jgi:hypothetical protein